MKQLKEYVEQGVTVYDVIDGADVAWEVAGLDLFNSFDFTPDDEPGYMLTYTAMDSSGNAAEPRIREVRHLEPRPISNISAE